MVDTHHYEQITVLLNASAKEGKRKKFLSRKKKWGENPLEAQWPWSACEYKILIAMSRVSAQSHKLRNQHFGAAGNERSEKKNDKILLRLNVPKK